MSAKFLPTSCQPLLTYLHIQEAGRWGEGAAVLAGPGVSRGEAWSSLSKVQNCAKDLGPVGMLEF